MTTNILRPPPLILFIHDHTSVVKMIAYLKDNGLRVVNRRKDGNILAAVLQIDPDLIVLDFDDGAHDRDAKKRRPHAAYSPHRTRGCVPIGSEREFMTASGQTVRLSSQLVLIVENDEQTREMYAEWLTFSVFRVAEARNGTEAIEKARALRPDVITMDLGLPGDMDGCQRTEHLKVVHSNEQHPCHRRDGVGNR
jgi:CheY-like chemotaxis protein